MLDFPGYWSRNTLGHLFPRCCWLGTSLGLLVLGRRRHLLPNLSWWDVDQDRHIKTSTHEWISNGEGVYNAGLRSSVQRSSAPPCGIRSGAVVCLQQFHLAPVAFAAAVSALCVLWFPNCFFFRSECGPCSSPVTLAGYVPLAWLPRVPPGALPFEMEESWTPPRRDSPWDNTNLPTPPNNLVFHLAAFFLFPWETGVIFFLRSLWCASPSASLGHPQELPASCEVLPGKHPPPWVAAHWAEKPSECTSRRSSARPARRPSSSSPHPLLRFAGWSSQSCRPSCDAGDALLGSWTLRDTSGRAQLRVQQQHGFLQQILPFPSLRGRFFSFLSTAKLPSRSAVKAGSPRCPALVLLNHGVHQNPLPASIPTPPWAAPWGCACAPGQDGVHRSLSTAVFVGRAHQERAGANFILYISHRSRCPVLFCLPSSVLSYLR